MKCLCCTAKGWPKRRVCDYPFFGGDGTEFFFKSRFALEPEFHNGHAKTFRYWWRPNPAQPYRVKWSKRDNADDILYRDPELKVALKAGVDQVWWAEGEKDADALRDHGAVAVSHHQGAGNASKAQAASFIGFGGQVVLVADRDAPGAADVLRRGQLLREVGLSMSNICIVKAATGKDAYDHLAAGHELADFVPITDLQVLRDAAKTIERNTWSQFGYLTPGHWTIDKGWVSA